ncbi:MAG TPA: hypothetical protein VL485_27660 [Ktedonobacteraceae bacterium]|jgi:hydrogenase maturation factor|nr:hypothetical protein [Ktedonobacteraceae bacterium]
MKQTKAIAMYDNAGKIASPFCRLDVEHHCLTCADEAIAVKVVHIDRETGLALVAANDQTEECLSIWEEIDITLVEHVVVGDILLAHGGVAIARP